MKTEFQGELKTPAKINLFLNITGKRADGYHLLETLFLPVNQLCDSVRISISSGDSISIVCSDTTIPSGPKNLCWKAVTTFLAQTSLKAKVELELTKEIPVAAGMGGGSSDAAAVLRLLQQWCTSAGLAGLSPQRLAKVAVSIGADVPFFLNPEPATAVGVGEELMPVTKNVTLPVLLVNPRISVSAGDAYQLWGKCGATSHISLDEVVDSLQKDVKAVAKLAQNVLGEAVAAKYPGLLILIEEMEKTGALKALVSGSGPTLFGIFESDEAVAKAEQHLIEKFGNEFWMRKVNL